jgi:hypothetical protein
MAGSHAPIDDADIADALLGLLGDAPSPTAPAQEPAHAAPEPPPAADVAEPETPAAAEPWKEPAAELAEPEPPVAEVAEPGTPAAEVAEPEALADEVHEPETPAAAEPWDQPATPSAWAAPAAEALGAPADERADWAPPWDEPTDDGAEDGPIGVDTLVAPAAASWGASTFEPAQDFTGDTDPDADPEAVAASVPPPIVVTPTEGSFDDGSRWAVVGVVVAMALIVAGVFVFGRGHGKEGARVATGESTSTTDATSTSSGPGGGGTKPGSGEGQTSDTSTSATTASTVPTTDTATSLPGDSSTTTASTIATTTTVPPPSPGHLTLGTPSVDFGTTGTTATAHFTNTGGQNLNWSAATSFPGLTVSPTSGVAAPGGVVTLTLHLDRAVAPEGNDNTSVSLTSNGGTAGLAVHAVVNRNPKFYSVANDQPIAYTNSGCGATQEVITASVTDDSPLTVSVVWTYSGGSPLTVTMTKFGSLYIAAITPFPHAGTVTYVVVATDVYGNSATSASGSQTFAVRHCS